MPIALAGGLIGGGLGLSALGGLVGGRSTNRAGRKARDFYKDQTTQGLARFAAQLYGSGAEDFLRGTLDDWTFDRLFGIGRFEGWEGGIDRDAFNAFAADRGVIPQLEDLATLTSTANRDIRERFDQGARTAMRDTHQNLGRFRRDMSGAIGEARQFGRGANQLIDENAAKALQHANQTAEARLAAAGLGTSSLGASFRAANTREIDRQAREQKLGVLNDRSRMLQGIRQNLAEGSGRLGDILAQRRLGIVGARTDVQNANLNRWLRQRLMPIQTQTAMMQAAPLNPWLGQNVSQFYPGASGGANALGTLGSGLTTLGAIGLAGSIFGGGGGGGGGGSPVVGYSSQFQTPIYGPIG